MKQLEAKRIARIESLFREVNERIAESAERFEADEAEFVCECDDPTCTTRVPHTLAAYDEVRADGTTFLLRPGHDNETVERVVEAGEHHVVVEKTDPVVALLVAKLNPRPS